MLLLMPGAGKDHRAHYGGSLVPVSGSQKPAYKHIKLIIEKCHNSLLFLQLVPIERALSRI